MKRLAAILLLLAGSCFAQTYYPVQGWCQDGGESVILQGLASVNPMQGSHPGCTVAVFNSGLLTQPTIYASSTGAPLPSTFTANLVNGFWVFYIAAATPVDVVLSAGTPAFPATVTLPDIIAGPISNFPTINVQDVSTGTLVNAYGDSFAACYLVSPVSACWANVFAAEKRFTLTNNGVNSTGVADAGQFGLAVQLVNTLPFLSYAYCCAINDMRNNLTSAQQLIWQQSYTAMLWMMATPESSKVRSSSAAVTYSGTWTLPPVNYSGNMISTVQNGATASFNVFGTDVVVIGAYQTANSSTWNVTIDSSYTTPTVTTDANAFCTIQFNQCFGPNWVHISGLAEQSHTVTFTCVSASAGNPCYFIAGGSSYGVGATGPFVYALETTYLETSPNNGYNVTSLNCPTGPCGSAALVAVFDQLEAEAVNELHNAGLNVLFVPLNAAYIPNTSNTQTDGVHPNATGSTLIGNALIAAAKGYLTPFDRGAAQTFGNIAPCTANASNGGFFVIGIGCIPGVQRGDLGASETETIGQVWLGHDGSGAIKRTGHNIGFATDTLDLTMLPNGICLTVNLCLYFGAGTPAATSTVCGSLNTGSIYLNTSAGSASTVEYVCQGSTWTAITVP